MQPGNSKALALCFDDHTDLLFSVGWNQPREPGWESRLLLYGNRNAVSLFGIQVREDNSGKKGSSSCALSRTHPVACCCLDTPPRKRWAQAYMDFNTILF
jgi:hypothetical protein